MKYKSMIIAGIVIMIISINPLMNPISFVITLVSIGIGVAIGRLSK